jgi:hypothetical protein
MYGKASRTISFCHHEIQGKFVHLHRILRMQYRGLKMIRSWDEMTGRNDWLIPASSSRPADGARNNSPTGSCPPQVPLMVWLGPRTPPCTMLKIRRPHWPTHSICRKMAIKLRLMQDDPCQDPSVILVLPHFKLSNGGVGESGVFQLR